MKNACIPIMIMTFSTVVVPALSGAAPALYTQRGTDPSFQSLLEDGAIPVGRNSRDGVTGSTIDGDNTLKHDAMIFVTGAAFT